MRHADVAVGDVVGSREHRQRARVRARGRHLDRDDAGVRMRGTHEDREGLLRHRHVVGVAAPSAHEPQILEPRQWAPDEGTSWGDGRGRDAVS
jgi:hypothetical protein